MNVIDSLGWLEYYKGSALTKSYAPYIEKPSELLVPAVVLYEVYRWIKQHESEEEAIKYAAQMSQSKVVPLDDALALFAADLSLEYKIAMADSIIYAAALSQNATLITSDNDFKELPNVVYFPKS